MDGLRLGLWGGQIAFSSTLELVSGAKVPTKIKSAYVWASIEYTYDNFVFIADYRVQTLKTYWSGIKSQCEEPEVYAVMASYRFTDWFELGTYFSWHFYNRDDRTGKENAEDYKISGGTRGFKLREEAWLKEFVVTTRFDVYDSWVIKLEGHLMNGLADVDYNPNDPNPELIWTLWTLKLSYSF